MNSIWLALLTTVACLIVGYPGSISIRACSPEEPLTPGGLQEPLELQLAVILLKQHS